MNQDIKKLHCDECGRGMEKSHRVHKTICYCGICYARIFKKRTCPQCGDLARLPVNDESAICRPCEKSKPCIRCQKLLYKIGKLTRYGPVCNSCSPYFREARPCGKCGVPSKHLSRVKRLGIDIQICPMCARGDHATCNACRRYRELSAAPDGRLICKVCANQGDKPCTQCGERMPAGRGKQCETCYWNHSLRNRITLDKAVFTLPKMANKFELFSLWLLNEVGAKKAALSVHRYLSFFTEIEKQWKSIPSYSELLLHFSAEGLRRVRLPMRWLETIGGLAVDADIREDDSERRRIEILLLTVKSGTSSDVIGAYYNALRARLSVGKTTLRSIRLALRPAVSMLMHNTANGRELSQEQLNQYLLQSPGQAAAITGFINFVNKSYGLTLNINIDDKGVRDIRRKKLELALIDFSLQAYPDNEDIIRKWLVLSLEFFHGLPRSVSKKISHYNRTFSQDIEGFSVAFRGEEYWVPMWKSNNMKG